MTIAINAHDTVPLSARKAARGARMYRASCGRFVEIIDVVAIFAAFVVATGLLTEGRLTSVSLADVLPSALGALAVWWTLRENDLFHYSAKPRPMHHAAKAFGALVLAAPLAVFAGMLAAQAVDRSILDGAKEAGSVVGLAGGVIIVIHFVAAAFVGLLSAAGVFSLNVVIVGATPMAAKIIGDAKVSGDCKILGIFDDRAGRVPNTIAGAEVLGDLDALMNWPHLPSVDRVIVTVSTAAQSRVKALVEKLRTMPNKVVLAIDMQGFDSDGTTIGRIGAQPVAYVSGAPEDARRAFWKRVQDIAIGSIALAILSPIMLAVAIAIKLDSKGPIFFRQVRHGFNNQIFKCWKFRSMRVDMTDYVAAQQVTKDDPRVTRVGRFIRKTSLDELPQLFNVLAGSMSLVGPRPHAIGMKSGGALSEKLVADYAHRHRIKPGMTGWAAINGSRGPVDSAEAVEKRVAYDVAYIKGAGFWFDLYIIFMTIPSLLGDKEAVR